MSLKRYLKENWGAPFVIGFMLLLITSAVELSIGQTDAANGIAVYAFYALVLGVALQIASYVKYGEGKPEPPEPAPRVTAPGRRSQPKVSRKVVAAIIIIVLAGVLLLGLYPPLRETVTPHFGPALVIYTGNPNVLPEPNGTTIVVLTAGAQGGSPPYSFTADWGDGVRQTSVTGIFQRSFAPGQNIPASADLTVKSSDGQTASSKVTIQS